MGFGAITLAGAGCLVALPWLAWRIGASGWPRARFTITGITAGVIVAPLALCLYFQFFMGPIRALVLGFPGLLLMVIHLGPWAASLASYEIVENSGVGVLSVLARLGWVMLTWAVVYGLVGALFDARRRRRQGVVPGVSGRGHR